MATTQAQKNPSWWTLEHETGWQKMKRSIQESWGKVKDATGGAKSDALAGYETAEPALKYGFGARQKYGTEWSEAAPQLEKEWAGLGAGRPWTEAQRHIKQGWESHTRHSSTDPRAQTSVRDGTAGFGTSGAGDSGSGVGDG